ncbi:hypothetical protein BDR22DRAFT_887236 [Usnea florida]
MLVPILLLLSLALLFFLLALFILRRPGLVRVRLARIPHAFSHRWRAQIKSRCKKALQLQRLSLERLSLESLSRGPPSAQNVAKLEDAGTAGYHNPFDPSPSPSPSPGPSLRDSDCSPCPSSEGLSSSPSPSLTPPPPLHAATSPRPSHSTNPISLRSEITPPPLPLPPQLPHSDPCQPQRIIKQAPQREGIEPSRAYYNVIPFYHGNDGKTGPRTLSPAIKSRSPVPSPLSWDTQLDKYFYADGVGLRGE